MDSKHYIKNKSFKSDSHKDKASRNLSRYIVENNIDIDEICKESGIGYNSLNESINLGQRNLEVDEFLEICNFIDEDPKKFK